MDNDQQDEKRFQVSPGSELSVSNVRGRTVVTAGDGSEIVVRYHSDGSRSFDPSKIEIEKSGNRVSVQTRSASTGLINFGRSTPVYYDITVPRDCSVRLHAVSSETSLEGSRGDAGIQTVSGDVRIIDVSGDITVTTVSGDVDARKLAGTLVARTTSGDLNALSSRLRRFSLNSVSGDFSIETPLTPDEHCTAKTVSGDLELRLPAGTGATVQLKSVSGDVTCEIPAEIIKAGRRHWQGRINGGGGNVEMNSVSGDLRITRSNTGGQAVADVAQPSAGRATDTASSPVEDEMNQTQEEGDMGDVLAALERGDISVEDAMSQIR